MSETKAIYLKSIGLSGSRKKAARRDALERAHAIREFEITLYWQRANYFWLLQAAVFAAVGLTWRNETAGFPAILPVAIAALGLVTAWAGWLATQGSKFWQRNWEHHIDMLESEFEGNLYKIVYISRSGIRWSLTGISETLALCFTFFWFAVLLLASFSANANWTLAPRDLAASIGPIEAETVGCWLFATACLFWLWRQVSGVSGQKINYPDESGGPVETLGRPTLRRSPQAKPFLVRREPSV